jgi:hypothetical protein
MENISKSVVNIVEGSAQLAETGTRRAFALANTGVDKGFILANDTLDNTLKTINVTQTAANKITQNIVTLGQQSITSSVNITKHAAKTSEIIASQGLDVASSAVISGADITKVGLEETKSVTTEGLKAVGQLATTSLSLTKNSLYAFIGRVDNILASDSNSILANKEKQKILNYKELYYKLQKGVHSEFKDEIKKFISNLDDFVKNQKQLFDTLINIYSMKYCNSGRFYGYNCKEEYTQTIVDLNRDLNILIKTVDTKITILKSFEQEFNSEMIKVKFDDKSDPREYANQISGFLNQYFLRASEMFEEILVKFNELAKTIDVNYSTANKDKLDEANKQRVGGKIKKNSSKKKINRKKQRKTKGVKNKL